MEMGGWALPVEYILTRNLNGNDLNEAVAYANTYPVIYNMTLYFVGVTDTSSSFYRISPNTSDNSITFPVSYQNSAKDCKVYLDTNGSALSIDEKQRNLLSLMLQIAVYYV